MKALVNQNHVYNYKYILKPAHDFAAVQHLIYKLVGFAFKFFIPLFTIL